MSRIFLSVLFVFGLSVNVVFAEEVTTPAALLNTLHQDFTGASWVTEEDLLLLHSDDLYLLGAMTDYAVIKKIVETGVGSSDVSLSTYSEMVKMYSIYKTLGADEQTLMDAYNETLSLLASDGAGLFAKLLDKYSEYVDNGLPTDFMSNTQSRFSRLVAIHNLVNSLTDQNTLSTYEAVSDLLFNVLGGTGGAIGGAYASFLFDTLGILEEKTLKTRVYFYAGLYHKSKTVSEESSYFYDDTLSLKASQHIYTFLNANQLDQMYFDTQDSGGNLFPYQEVVSSYLNQYGMNNSQLSIMQVQDTMFEGQSFLKFIASYKNLMDIYGASSWSELLSYIKSDITSAVNDINTCRTSISVKVAKPDSDGVVALLNDSEYEIFSVYITDNDLLSGNDTTTILNSIKPGELKWFNVNSLDEMYQLRYNIVGKNESVILDQVALPDIISDIHLSYNGSSTKTYENINFSLISNINQALNTTAIWEVDGEEVYRGDDTNIITHVFTTSGEHQVSVTVEESGQVIHSNTKTVNINANDSIIPTKPVITASSATYSTDQNITMTATSTAGDDAENIVYYWSYTPTGEAFATEQTIEVTPHGETYTQYFVKATNMHGTSPVNSVTLYNNDYTPPESNGDIVLKPYTVTDSGGSTHTVSTFYLSGVHNGNISLEGGTLDLQGSTLTINGDFNLGQGESSNCNLKVNGGRLIVMGNLTVKGMRSQFQMTNPNDYVLIYGNASFAGEPADRDTDGYLTEGVLELKGNFYQRQWRLQYCYDQDYTFRAENNHKVIFSGDKKQIIDFNQSSSGSGSHFNILEIKNTSIEGVDFNKNIPVTKQLITHDKPLNSITLKGMSYTLTDDMVIDGNLTFGSTSSFFIDLNGYTLTVNGDFDYLGQDERISVGGGDFKVNGGRLIVRGDLIVKGNSSQFQMTNPNDYVLIYGDASFAGEPADRDTDGYLTEGVLELKGNFYQRQYRSGYSYDQDYTFRAENNHKVILSGDKKQIIGFNQSSSGSGSHFNILEITNTSDAGIVFANKVVVSTLFKHNQNIFTLTNLSSIFPDADNDGLSDSVENSGCADIENSDTDGDGLSDGLEDANRNGIIDTGETNPCDADTDDDGIPDGVEDTNKNGIVDAGETDPNNIDTDNDDIFDGVELGLTLNDISEDTDLQYFLADLDPATTTNPLMEDSDEDGIKDGLEDFNQNGRIDEGESGPNAANSIPLIGDVNMDGVVNIKDLMITLKTNSAHSVSTTTASDINDDGKIDLNETIYILKEILAPK